MFMQKIPLLLALVLMVGAVPAAFGAEKEGKGKAKAEKVALDQVPANILAAAGDAVKGFKATEAEKTVKGDKVIWEVEGTAADGKTYEIKVDGSGKVLKAKEAKQGKEGDKEGDGEKDDDKDDKK
jgi:hypothetical protein